MFRVVPGAGNAGGAMLASRHMRNRALFVIVAKAVALTALAVAGAGCGGPGKNRVMTDTPALPYLAPDIDELTGIDSEADEADEAEPADEAPTPPAK